MPASVGARSMDAFSNLTGEHDTPGGGNHDGYAQIRWLGFQSE
jgi:hypothetical protein